jgi:hypothetical protein
MAMAVTVQMQELAISVSSGVITKPMILGGRFCIRFYPSLEYTLFKMRLHKTYNKARLDKHLSETSPIQNGLKQGRFIVTAF